MTLSKNARVAGLLYLLGSLFGIVRLIYVPNTLFVYGNATATAKNIAEHELLFRFGIVSYLLCAALWIFVTLALYRLFKAVNQALAVLMVILGSLMVTPIFFVNTVNDAAALLLVRGGGSDRHEPHNISRWQLSVLLFLARRAPDTRSRAVSRRRGQVLA
jgi:hypothetical protein